MRRCFRRHVSHIEPGKVLEVGSRSRKAEFRHLWQRNGWQFTGCDLAAGPNVDIVLDDPFDFPIENDTYDAVISGQMLEHNTMFWLTFLEMSRVLKMGGLMVHIAPSRGPEHRAPTDCWRFYRDGFRALADWSGFETLEVGTDWSSADIEVVEQRSRRAAEKMRNRVRQMDTLWGDTVGVFRKTVATDDSEGMRYIRRFAARDGQERAGIAAE